MYIQNLCKLLQRNDYVKKCFTLRRFWSKHFVVAITFVNNSATLAPFVDILKVVVVLRCEIMKANLLQTHLSHFSVCFLFGANTALC